MIPNKAGFLFSDLDIAGCLERCLGAMVVELDPDATYKMVGMSGLEQEICRLVEKHRINLLVYWTAGYDFRPRFLYDKLSHVFKVLMTGDDEYGFDNADRYYGQCFDLVLTHNPLNERYQIYGIDSKVFPSVYDSSIFCPGEQRPRDIPVSFIGTALNKTGREGAVRQLMDAGIEVQLYGPGSSAGVLPRDRVIDVYRRSCINLNFTGMGSYALDSEQTIVRRIRQVKGRCTKIALCGSFVLSEYAPGIEKWFHIGREIDVFNDESELLDKARFYLTHEDVREKMATRAHARALEDYDESKYWTSMGRMIEERAAEKRHGRWRRLPLYVDRPFWAAYGAWRFKYLAIFFFMGKLGLFLEELLLLIRAGRFNPTAAIWMGAAGLHTVRQSSKVADWIAVIAHKIRKLGRPGV
ncbi:glycosyltransferase [Candidatus Nitronereus thalassa]|uniref:Glycosyltransferase n=1 Tax=Candidatus Nitronereus thalassa TaxID=3020898 RepID=A0ABU3K5J5_9BACT|nr:glycosyltransferase [Candidatus Nitronereus thalassa]MDT7041665.1 glycosyltransferase [Candidatus Nitronereus thalassa]